MGMHQQPGITNVSLDHGNLNGLLEDDHTQYILADGSRNMVGTASWGISTTQQTVLALHRDIGADNSFIDLLFQADDDGGVVTTYGKIAARIIDNTSPNEVGRMSIFTLANDATLRRAIDFWATEIVLNPSAFSNMDLRVLGESLGHMLFTDATATTENIALLATAAPNWQTMDRGIFMGDASQIPTGNPASGGFLYVEAGALTYRGSGGTITVLGAA